MPEIFHAFSRCVAASIWLAAVHCATFAQGLSLEEITRELDQNKPFISERLGVRVELADFTAEGKKGEALAFVPLKAGKHPGLLLIPGYSRTARDYIPLGIRMAREGFVCLAVTQPGFGKSEGPADFVGPATLALLTEGYAKLKTRPDVDAGRLGVFGYSRGAMAAALLATRLPDLKAAVLGAGIYDLKKAHDDITLPGIRENIAKETGMKEEALRERSAFFFMDKLNCPVMILHGEKDVNAPVNQAHHLKARLEELKKPFEIQLFPDRDHDLGRDNLNKWTLDFFSRKLKGTAAGKPGDSR